MQYRLLGNSGVNVSAVGLGCNQFGGKVNQEDTTTIVHRAIDLGINFLDTADVYSRGRSEEFLGVALKGKWDKVVLATKFKSPMGEGPNDKGASRYHIMAAVEASLKRLDTDHIDLLQVHSFDPQTPFEETMRALDDLVSQGKVRYLGASNYLAWQLSHANDIAQFRGWTSFISIQPHYHMLERSIERELVPYARFANIGILPFFPLAGGFLTGKYQEGQPAPEGTRGAVAGGYVSQYFTPENYSKVRKLTAWAEERGHTMGELAIAWLLGQPQMASVISGASKLEQVEANVKAAEWQLSADELAEVRAVLEGKAS
ncbi:MAG: aldo/keto reductase [Chloroflexi bacterium]|nr:aldo/keto reductase [Chloroflexota bacterium]OJW02756.1 MAG: aldo/keto reductase [Chloroflexi bacterium 54-19]